MVHLPKISVWLWGGLSNGTVLPMHTIAHPPKWAIGCLEEKKSSDYSASCPIKQMTITITLLTQHTVMQNPPRSRLHLYKHPDMWSNQSNFTIATRIHRVSIPWYYIHIGVHISLWGVCISPIGHRGGHVTTCVNLTGVECCSWEVVFCTTQPVKHGLRGQGVIFVVSNRNTRVNSWVPHNLSRFQ